MQRVLDPAVGVADLLIPFQKLFSKAGSLVTCVDCDALAIRTARKRLKGIPRAIVRSHTGDFLKWSMNRNPIFDCVVMNPPFAAGRQSLQKLTIRQPGLPILENTYMPLEAAFLCRAISLLRDGGRLLGVVPASVVSSESTAWLRRFLLEAGAIKMVHELPPNSFPGVESRMYLISFDRARRSRSVMLMNHDLTEPERMDVSIRDLVAVNRLDFCFHRANSQIGKLKDLRGIQWSTLGNEATVIRGSVRTPLNSAPAVHSSNFSAGFWRRGDLVPPSAIESKIVICKGDLLVKRVGRDCRLSFGKPVALEGLPCSDCVLIVRPNDRISSDKLLFAIRTMLEFGFSKGLLERGTGASYMSHTSVGEFPIPINLDKTYPKLFSEFCNAQRSRSPERMKRSSAGAGKLLAKRLRKSSGLLTGSVVTGS